MQHTDRTVKFLQIPLARVGGEARLRLTLEALQIAQLLAIQDLAKFRANRADLAPVPAALPVFRPGLPSGQVEHRPRDPLVLAKRPGQIGRRVAVGADRSEDGIAQGVETPAGKIEMGEFFGDVGDKSGMKQQNLKQPALA